MSEMRVAWDHDNQNRTSTAILKQKDEDGNFVEVTREQFDFETLERAGVGTDVALYGMSKIMQDRASAYSGQDKLEAMKREYDSLASGTFKKERSGGGSGGGGISPVVEAISEVKGISIAAANKAWKQQSDEDKQAIQERLQEKIAEIKERRKQQAGADLSDLT